MTVTKFGLALAGLAFSASFAFAQAPAFKPAIVYDLGGKFDKSFNEGVHTGAEKYKKDTGTD
jgi:basic membrane protein A and related proteins